MFMRLFRKGGSRCSCKASTRHMLFSVQQLLTSLLMGSVPPLRGGALRAYISGCRQCSYLAAKGTERKGQRKRNRSSLQPGLLFLLRVQGFPRGTGVRNLPASAEDAGPTPGLGRSPGEGNGHLLPYSCLETARDSGAWRAIVHGVAKSWT